MCEVYWLTISACAMSGSPATVIANEEVGSGSSPVGQLFCCDPTGSDEKTGVVGAFGDADAAGPPPAAFRTIRAPPGALGVVFGTHTDGHACIYDVKSESPLYGKVGIGDVVMDINGDDMSKHTHAEIEEYLAAKVDVTKTLRLLAPLRTIVAPPGPLGIVFSDHDDGHGHIDEVKPDGALRHALSVGDVIIALDGEDTFRHDTGEIVRRLGEKRDVERTLLVRRCLKSAHGAVGAELPSDAFQSIAVPPGKLGVFFDMHADGHAIVAEVKPESTSGLLVGDVVVSINGDDTSKHPPEELVKTLGETEGQGKTLTVRRTPPAAEPSDTPAVVASTWG